MKTVAVVSAVALALAALGAPAGAAKAQGDPARDLCARPSALDGMVSWVNAGAHVGRHVTTIRQLHTPDVVPLQENDGSDGGLVCYGGLVFDDGSVQWGYLSLRDPGGSAPLSVNWRPDTQCVDECARAKHP